MNNNQIGMFYLVSKMITSHTDIDLDANEKAFLSIGDNDVTTIKDSMSTLPVSIIDAIMKVLAVKVSVEGTTLDASFDPMLTLLGKKYTDLQAVVDSL